MHPITKLHASPQQSFTHVSNTFSKTPSKLSSFVANSLDHNRSTELSPSLLLRSKFAHFNNQLLLPRCLQKSLTKKFTLSPLIQLNDKSQSAFKLKNYFRQQQRPFDQPTFNNNDQRFDERFKRHDNDYQVRLSLLGQNTHQENKQNLNYHNQLAQMMITKSKLKYSPRDTLRMTKTKWNSQQSNKSTQKSQEKVQNSILSRSNTMMNFSKFSFQKRNKRASSKELQPLLNSTRSKLLCQMQKIPIQKITKKDIFPLEKLMEKRAHKTSFRNKWFTAKTLENQVNEE